MSASDQSSHDQRGERPSLLDRLRNLFGLGSASIRDDIEDALDDESIQSDLSAQDACCSRTSWACMSCAFRT